jgi:hypothetical protein
MHLTSYRTRGTNQHAIRDEIVTVAKKTVDFTWEVHAAGYMLLTTTALDQQHPAPPPEWLDDAGQTLWREAERTYTAPRVFVTSGVPTESHGFQLRRYAPLETESGLFRDFADTEVSPEGVLAFAGKYGLLGGDQAKLIALDSIDASGKRRVGVGEELEDWYTQIIYMRESIRLWKAATEGKSHLLLPSIAWGDDNTLTYRSSTAVPGLDTPSISLFEVITSPHSAPGLLSDFATGDIIRPAKYLVQRWVNQNLAERAAPRLLWDRHKTSIDLYIVPKSLLGALWFQLAHSIDARVDYRQCDFCKRWFEVSPDVARTNRRYCADRCRSRSYRRRIASRLADAAELDPDQEHPMSKSGRERSSARRGHRS